MKSVTLHNNAHAYPVADQVTAALPQTAGVMNNAPMEIPSQL